MAIIRFNLTIPYESRNMLKDGTHYGDGVNAMIRRILVAIVGGAVLTLGVALIVLPGPAFIVIPAGLTILALEFAWAKHWLRSGRAVLMRRRGNESAPRKRFTPQSVWRAAKFLFRQFIRTVTPRAFKRQALLPRGPRSFPASAYTAHAPSSPLPDAGKITRSSGIS